MFFRITLHKPFGHQPFSRLNSMEPFPTQSRHDTCHSQRGLTWHNFRLAFDLEISRCSRLQQLLRGLVTPPCLHVVPKDLREPDQKKHMRQRTLPAGISSENFGSSTWLHVFFIFFLYHHIFPQHRSSLAESPTNGPRMRY